MVRQTTTPKKDLGTGTNKPPKHGEKKHQEKSGQQKRDENRNR